MYFSGAFRIYLVQHNSRERCKGSAAGRKFSQLSFFFYKPTEILWIKIFHFTSRFFSISTSRAFRLCGGSRGRVLRVMWRRVDELFWAQDPKFWFQHNTERFNGICNQQMKNFPVEVFRFLNFEVNDARFWLNLLILSAFVIPPRDPHNCMYAYLIKWQHNAVQHDNINSLP